MSQWFYAQDGQQQGPLSEEALIRMFKSGQLKLDVLVWHQGLGEWRSAKEVGGLVPAAVMPPPIPESYVAEEKAYPPPSIDAMGSESLSANAPPQRLVLEKHDKSGSTMNKMSAEKVKLIAICIPIALILIFSLIVVIKKEKKEMRIAEFNIRMEKFRTEPQLREAIDKNSPSKKSEQNTARPEIKKRYYQMGYKEGQEGTVGYFLLWKQQTGYIPTPHELDQRAQELGRKIGLNNSEMIEYAKGLKAGYKDYIEANYLPAF